MFLKVYWSFFFFPVLNMNLWCDYFPLSEREPEGANSLFEGSSESSFFFKKCNSFLSQLAFQRRFKYSYYQILSTSARNYLNFPICSLKTSCIFFSNLPAECRLSYIQHWIYSGSRNITVWFRCSWYMIDKNASLSQSHGRFSGKSNF